jgi:hypothetical protein
MPNFRNELIITFTKMKKVKFWDVWDRRSVIYSIIAILILGSIFYFVTFPVTDSLRESKSETMTERTKGVFISSKNVDRESQGRMGNRTITDGVVIDYSYEVRELCITNLTKFQIAQKISYSLIDLVKIQKWF